MPLVRIITIKNPPNTFRVTFDSRGGSTISLSSPLESGSVVVEPEAPKLHGHRFDGWYRDSSGINAWVFATSTIVQDTTLYAKWTAETYRVVLAKQSGSGGSDSVSATFGSAMPDATAPRRAGYSFDGYFSSLSDGVQYYTAEMASARKWDSETLDTLYARWTAKTYSATLAKQSGSGGSNTVKVTSGSTMPSATEPKRAGYSFEGYFSSPSGGEQYYTPLMASAKNWDSDTLDTLYAQWSASAFSVTLDKRSGSDGTSTVTVTFDAPMPDASPPELQGYNFAGYFDAASGGTQYYDSLMASAREWDKVGEATLYAHWNPIAYTISYNLNGGSNVAGNPATYTIESTDISLKDPSKPEFDFIAWYSDSSFNDSVTKIPSGSVGNKELFAKWKRSCVSSRALRQAQGPATGLTVARSYCRAHYRSPRPLCPP